MDCAQVIYTAHQDGKLAKIMEKSWDLYDTPSIRNLKVLRLNHFKDVKGSNGKKGKRRIPQIIALTDMPNSVEAQLSVANGKHKNGTNGTTEEVQYFTLKLCPYFSE